MWLSIIAVLGKVLDLLNPWSKFWAQKATDSEKRKQQAKLDLRDAANKGDFDAFDDARADRDNA